MKAICKIKVGLHFAKCRRFWWILECVQKLNIICWICLCLMCKYKGRISISEVQMVNIQCQCSMPLVWFGMCWLLCGTLGGKLKFQLESTPDPAAPGIPAHGHRPLVNTSIYRCFGLFGKQFDIYSWAGGTGDIGDIGDIPPILGIPSPSSRWVPLTRDRHQQMESQPTPWENPTQALLYIDQDYIVSKLQSSFQGFCGRPSHQMHLFRHDTALSLLAPGNLPIWWQSESRNDSWTISKQHSGATPG